MTKYKRKGRDGQSRSSTTATTSRNAANTSATASRKTGAGKRARKSDTSDVDSDAKLDAESQPRSRHNAKRHKRQQQDLDSDVDTDTRSRLQSHRNASDKRQKKKKQQDSDSDTDSDARYQSRSRKPLPSKSSKTRHASYSDTESDIVPRQSRHKTSSPKRKIRHDSSHDDSPPSDDDSPPSSQSSSADEGSRIKKKSETGQGKDKHNNNGKKDEKDKGKENDELQVVMKGMRKKENNRIAVAMSSARDYMKKHFPAMTKERFEKLAPKYPHGFTQEGYEVAEAKWMVDPLRPLLLGQHQRFRESFLAVYRTLLRYYNCLYEDFIGPRFQLQYDNGDNPKVILHGDRDEDAKQIIYDPFPSKAFFDNLNCLLLQPVWFGNLERLATCLQFVNILRTNDTCPWNLVDCDDESLFFKTWQRVVKENLDAEKPTEDLFAQVKARFGNQGLYCALFDQIIDSVRAKRRPSEDHTSKRRSNGDPYFIKAVDLTILMHALDNIGYFGIPLLHTACFTEAAVKLSRPDQDYPRASQFTEARDQEIIYTRMMRQRVTNDISKDAIQGDGTLNDIRDDGNRPPEPIANVSEQRARGSMTLRQRSNSCADSSFSHPKEARKAEVGHELSPVEDVSTEGRGLPTANPPPRREIPSMSVPFTEPAESILTPERASTNIQSPKVNIERRVSPQPSSKNSSQSTKPMHPPTPHSNAPFDTRGIQSLAVSRNPPSITTMKPLGPNRILATEGQRDTRGIQSPAFGRDGLSNTRMRPSEPDRIPAGGRPHNGAHDSRPTHRNDNLFGTSSLASSTSSLSQPQVDSAPVKRLAKRNDEILPAGNRPTSTRAIDNRPSLSAEDILEIAIKEEGEVDENDDEEDVDKTFPDHSKDRPSNGDQKKKWRARGKRGSGINKKQRLLSERHNASHSRW